MGTAFSDYTYINSTLFIFKNILILFFSEKSARVRMKKHHGIFAPKIFAKISITFSKIIVVNHVKALALKGFHLVFFNQNLHTLGAVISILVCVWNFESQEGKGVGERKGVEEGEHVRRKEEREEEGG